MPDVEHDPLLELKALDEVETKKERERQRAAALALLILDGLPDALIVTDVAGVIVMVNRRAEAMFGYDRSELLGRTIECLMPERLRERHVTLRERFNRYGVASPVRAMGQSLRLMGLDRAGREFPTEIMLAQLVVPDGMLDLASIRHSSESNGDV